MEHLEVLGLLEDLKRGRLEPAHAVQMNAHLEGCPDCQALALRWPAEPLALRLDLRVLAQLREEARPARWVWAPSVAAAFAVILVVSAFWRPEHAWVRLDKGFDLRVSQTKGGR